MSFVVVLMAAAGMLLLASGLACGRRRISSRVEPYLSGLHGKPSTLLAPRPPARGRVATMLRRLPLGDDEPILARIAASGLQTDLDRFRLEQLTWAATSAAGATALVGLFAATGAGIDVRVVPVLAAVCFVFGWAARDWWLTRQVRHRAESLRDQLPLAIDIITLSIMAGESVPSSFARAARVLPEGLGGEIGRVVSDVRAGSSVAEALEAMGRRMDDPSVGRLVDALITGIEHGTPLAEVLRAQADDGRAALRRRLLESAGSREVLMLVPVVFLILPVVVLYALYPGLVSLDLLVP
jgi:tight adherence protein C